MKKTTLITLLCFCVISMQICAQQEAKITSTTQQKRPLTPEDYKLWNTIGSHAISNNGNWYTYKISNAHSKESTLTVGSTKNTTTTKYVFPNGSGKGFSPESKWFAYTDKEKGFGLLDLKTGNTQWLPNISNFDFIGDTYLMGYTKPTETITKKSLLILDLTTGKQESIPNVIEYKYNAAINQLAYITETKGSKSVNLRTLETTSITTTITKNTAHKYLRLTWNSTGNALIFLQELSGDPEKEINYKLYYYNTKQGVSKLKSLDTSKDASLFEGMTISHAYWKQFEVSEDGSIVLFSVRGTWDVTTGRYHNPDVEVWNTKDKTFSRKLKEEVYDYGPWLTAWWPETGQIQVLEKKEFQESESIIARDHKHMLSFNPNGNGPFFKFSGAIDLYLTNLETGERHLFLKQQEYGKFGFNHNVEISPGGQYISYFRDQHWWIYDLKKKTHTNVTKELGVQLYETADDGAHAGVSEPYRRVRWATDDKELLIHSKYDVWFISPKGKARRLTKGKENQIRYRLERQLYKDGQFDPSQGLVLKAFGTTNVRSGYAIWKPKKGLETMVYKDMRVSRLKKAKDREAYIYTEESFKTPPRLRYWESGMSESRILVETNLQHNQFQWGHSELIHYTDNQGKALQGALFYPANYNSGEKYPMVVYIYEHLSGLLHRYINPSEYSTAGFNRTNYTLEGYFVFLPDIKHAFNDVGVSAVRCIEAGVEAVLKKGMVEADHMGLIGHSFGGYETAFAITQTNLFTTAVAGSANTDLISNYHSIQWGDGMDKSRMFWYEGQQWRFKDSFYKNPEAYFRNSPLHHITNIKTPLLLWTGKKDTNVDWHQSIELYTGLRRLGKPCELLLYPDEKHTIVKPKNQVDLTRRIKAWFDSYLKAPLNLPKGETFGTEKL